MIIMIETSKIVSVLGGEKKTGMRPANGLEFALALRAGLQYAAVAQLAKHTGI
jgi:hypothetical protein